MTSGQLATSRAQIYTMRFLNQHTAEVVQEINNAGEPAAITLRGRFIALIAPIAKIDIESALLYSVLEESENVNQLTGENTLSAITAAGDVDEALRSKGPREHQASRPKPLVFSMRYLNQRTAHVMQAVNEARVPAAITRHGQFVALIIPLAEANVESAILSTVLEQTDIPGQQFGGDTYSS